MTSSGEFKKISVCVPATTSNLGPGFDTLGLALTLYNTIEVEVSDRNEMIIEGEGKEELYKSNLFSVALKSVFRKAGKKVPPLKLRIKNQIPLKRGLGSSATAYLGGLIAGNYLAKANLDTYTLVKLAVNKEGHPDNVCAALCGGLVASCMTKKGIFWTKIPISTFPKIIVAVPELEVETKKARSVLPKMVSYKDAVFNLSHTALLIGAFITGNWSLLSEAMKDKLHQPYRQLKDKLISKAINAALEAGALGAALSGSGSSVIVFVENYKKAITAAIQTEFKKYSIQCRIFELEVDIQGTRCVTPEETLFYANFA